MNSLRHGSIDILQVKVGCRTGSSLLPSPWNRFLTENTEGKFDLHFCRDSSKKVMREDTLPVCVLLFLHDTRIG